MTKYEGTFDIWFDMVGDYYKTRILVQKSGKDYWHVIVPIGDNDSGSNIHLRAALEFIEEHWKEKGVLNLTASRYGNSLYLIVKSLASKHHIKSYKLKTQRVEQL